MHCEEGYYSTFSIFSLPTFSRELWDSHPVNRILNPNMAIQVIYRVHLSRKKSMPF